MSKTKISNIIDNLRPIIEEEAKKEFTTTGEVLSAIAGLYSMECERIAENCTSKEDLDNAEKWIRDILLYSYRRHFDAKRKQLLERNSYPLAPSINTEQGPHILPSYSIAEVFFQIASILTENNVTSDDALHIIGQLASTVAMIEGKSCDPVTEDKLKEIEEQIVGHLYGQVTNGLYTIRLKQGLIKSN